MGAHVEATHAGQYTRGLRQCHALPTVGAAVDPELVRGAVPVAGAVYRRSRL